MRNTLVEFEIGLDRAKSQAQRMHLEGCGNGRRSGGGSCLSEIGSKEELAGLVFSAEPVYWGHSEARL